ncbi:hypothetical protein [Streptomyces sp. NPDC018610]|uniref:hypothetical protein n=1 Tax=Streptomyces sp. NPDC018610 TaxID=3365049 RepID=UPI0037B6F89A
MQSATPRDALIITAAATVGAVVAARWWARHHPLSAPRSLAAGQDVVGELQLVLSEPTAASNGAPRDVLRRHWDRLHALDLAPAPADLPVVPTA